MSLLASLRRGVSARLRKLMVGFVLLGGALGGMPMRPDEIEELMRNMSETKIVTMSEVEDGSGKSERGKEENLVLNSERHK